MNFANTPDGTPAANTKRRFNPKLIAVKLILLASSMCVGLLLLELGVRVFLPYYNPKARIVYYIDDEGVSRGPPNATVHHGTPKGDFQLDIKFNQYGLRDAKDLKHSTTNDLFALGDSFTMGWGVRDDERFSGRLEKALHRPVFNVASPENILGYVKLLRYARQHGAQVHNLIIGICMENDLRDYRDGKTSADFLRTSDGRDANATLRHPRHWLLMHSAAYKAITYFFQKSPLIRRTLERVGLARNMEVSMGKNVDSEDVLQSSCQAVAGIATNYQTVVLIIPSRGLWRGDNSAVEKKVHARFVELLRAAGLNVVDVKPQLEQTGDPLSYYFKTDPHWTARGHELAAEELRQFYLVHSNLLDRVP